MMQDHWGYGNNGGGDIWNFVFMLFMMAFVLIGVIFLVRHLGNSSGIIHHNDSPLDILKNRYAKGEITKDQYEQLKKDLAN